MNLSIGKLRGLQQLADDDGFLTICAIDHRGALQRALNAKNPDSVTYQEMVDFKLDLCRTVGHVVSAVLLDPVYGAAQAIAAGGQGLPAPAVAAIGELYFGAARGARNFIYITLSTGIGSGIIIDGEIYTGSTGTAGELGHMVIDDEGPVCNCGNRGCWETLASGTALAREAREQVKAGNKTSILDYAEGEIERISAEAVHKAAQAGDSPARELIARTGYYVGVGLANLINIFNPEMIVIGGGLSNIGDMLLEPAYEEAERRAFKPSYRAVRFARAELGRNSGVIGAAIFARNEMERLDKSPGP